jgi:glutamate-5-semialdehyde dehydrogenase
MIDIMEFGSRARICSKFIALAPTEKRNAVLLDLSEKLLDSAETILSANHIDIVNGNTAGLSESLLDRLLLNESRLSGISSDILNIANLPDPLGETFDEKEMSNGLQIYKVRVPIGVIGVIYESRPNVTIDIAALAIKTGNAAILRGGSETIHTNRALVNIIRQVLESNELPADVIQFIDDPDRALVTKFLRMHNYVDILIPRGGASLHQYCRENSSIPVITGGIGICHMFVDRSANLEAAVEVIRNAKTQRPSVCNALDTVLIHKEIANEFLPLLVEEMAQDQVVIHAHETTYSYLNVNGDIKGDQVENLVPGQELKKGVVLASSNDFDVEWLSLQLGIKVVEGIEEAIAHIQQHSTGHSDGILTEDEDNARKFVAEVDSSATYINASTRFTDGGQLGLGAEVAVSTQRLHARGPMGPRELTTYKWVIRGNYHTR